MGVRSPVRVVGRYAICDAIGSGGMATVHIARLLGPVGFSRIVAVKRMHPHLAKDPEFVAMFLDEARVAARVQHANVIATLDVVAHEGELLLVMDYVEGESFSRILRSARKKGMRLPLPILGGIMSQTLYGLHAVHEARGEEGRPLGLVHRDISPDNILVGRDGMARVLDFGIAKATELGRRTQAGQIKGKVAYMSPEHIRSQPLDRRTDIYAASAVLWESVTGHPLFEGASDPELVHKVLTQSPRSPREILPDVGSDVEALLMRGLSGAREDRFATAREMAIEVEKVFGVSSPAMLSQLIEGMLGKELGERATVVEHAMRATAEISSAQVRDAGLALDAPAVDMPDLGPLSPDPIPRKPAPEPAAPGGFKATVQGGFEQQPFRANPPSASDQAPLAPTPSSAGVALGTQVMPDLVPIANTKPSLQAPSAPAPPNADRFPPLAGPAQPSPRTTFEDEPREAPLAMDVDSPPPPRGGPRVLSAAVLPAPSFEVLGYGNREIAKPNPFKPLLLPGAVLALLLAVGAGYAVTRKPPATSSSAPVGPQAIANEAACETLRRRVRSGGQAIGLSRDGWVAELWLRGRDGATVSQADIDLLSLKGPDPASSYEVGSLSAYTRTTNEGLVVTLSGPVVAAAFEQQGAGELIKAADRAFEQTKAEAGAIYLKCRHLPHHDVGLWFRGRDLTFAAASLMFAMGTYSDAPVIRNGELPRPGAQARATSFDDVLERVKQAKLDPLQNELERQGITMQQPSGSSIRLTFPSEKPSLGIRGARVVAGVVGIEAL